MILTWNLTGLFKSNEAFYQEITNVKNKLLDIKKYENLKLDEYLLFELLGEYWIIKELANHILVYGSLMYYKNVNSEECIELKSVAEKLNNHVNFELGFIDRKILSLGKKMINEFIIKNHHLEIYKLYLDNLFRSLEHVQNDEVRVEIKDNIDHINVQLDLYNAVLRDIKYGEIAVDGKMIMLTSSNVFKR